MGKKGKFFIGTWVNEEVNQKLEEICKIEERSKSYIISKVITDYCHSK